MQRKQAPVRKVRRIEVAAAKQRSGAGFHQDRRTKRQRTRGDALRAEMRTYA